MDSRRLDGRVEAADGLFVGTSETDVPLQPAAAPCRDLPTRLADGLGLVSAPVLRPAPRGRRRAGLNTLLPGVRRPAGSPASVPAGHGIRLHEPVIIIAASRYARSRKGVGSLFRPLSNGNRGSSAEKDSRPLRWRSYIPCRPDGKKRPLHRPNGWLDHAELRPN